MTETKPDAFKETMLSIFEQAEDIVDARYGTAEMILSKRSDPPFFIAEEMRSELNIRTCAFEATLKALIKMKIAVEYGIQ